ncbi:hypothetical protein B0H13DRAFT_1491193, partial [Mycena leptocephala]
TRKIGNSTFPPIGFGAMGISSPYGAVESNEERFKVRMRTLVLGVRLLNSCRSWTHKLGWDTAGLYGDSEELIEKWHAHNP